MGGRVFGMMVVRRVVQVVGRPTKGRHTHQRQVQNDDEAGKLFSRSRGHVKYFVPGKQDNELKGCCIKARVLVCQVASEINDGRGLYGYVECIPQSAGRPV